ncbi:DNA polymerase [Sesamum angolense]|uniref:DNA polymerase n=1 Tax=Sesamum angolense TaxID=2727404 RepID=A0AAE1X0D2_9LAMI|nr:DNA polymerase [Sesamum angolense]
MACGRAHRKKAEISPATEVATSKPVSGLVGFIDSAIEVVDLEYINTYFTLLSKASKEGKDIGMYLLRLILECSSIAIASGLEWIKLSRVMDSVGMPTLMDRPAEGKSKGRKKRRLIPEWTSRRRSQDDRPGAKTLPFMWKANKAKEGGKIRSCSYSRSTITEVCLEYRYNYLIRNSELIFIEKLNELYYVISYWDNPGNYCWKGDPSERWNPPRISAIQLAAAITASARIYMYPFISREDCYYTDTDSVVLGQPLPEEWISSSTLEKERLALPIQEDENRLGPTKKGMLAGPRSLRKTLSRNGRM